MSVNQVDKQTGDTSRIAGGTLYADAPIGAILAFGGATAPAGWMICNGAAISRTTYAALFAVIGTAYGAGDGSTTFNLPDPREAALVGAGTNVLNAGSIAAHNAVNLGAFQDDQFQTHAHHVYINNDPNYPVLSNKNLKADGEDYWNVNPSGTYPIVASTEYEGNRAGTTTHGKQLGVNYIIKAEQVALPADFNSALERLDGLNKKDISYTYQSATDLAGVIKEILDNQLPPTTTESGVYTGNIVSTHGGGGDLGSWKGFYNADISKNQDYRSHGIVVCQSKVFNVYVSLLTDGWIVETLNQASLKKVSSQLATLGAMLVELGSVPASKVQNAYIVLNGSNIYRAINQATFVGGYMSGETLVETYFQMSGLAYERHTVLSTGEITWHNITNIDTSNYTLELYY